MLVVQAVVLGATALWAREARKSAREARESADRLDLPRVLPFPRSGERRRTWPRLARSDETEDDRPRGDYRGCD